MKTLNELEGLVIDWAATRGILDKASLESQFKKTLEEIKELADAIENEDYAEFIDGIGDVGVTLIILARLGGTSFNHCLDTAYEVISKRTGRMVDGIFVKDTDDDLNEPLGEQQPDCNGDTCESCQ